MVLKYILITSVGASLWTCSANAANITNYTDLYNGVAGGGDFAILNNIQNNPLGLAIDAKVAVFSFTDDLAIDASLPELGADFLAYGNNKNLSVSGTNVSGFYSAGPSLSLIGFGNISGFSAVASDNFHPGGGVVDNTSGLLTIYSSTFSNNHTDVTGSSIGNALGGAIYNAGTDNSLISGSVFANNFAASGANSKYAMGGAIYNNTSGSGDLTINDSSFSQNLAYSEGLNNNNSESFGGAIVNGENAHLIINNSSFAKNLAYATSDHIGDSFGGAVFNTKGGVIDISTTTFVGNQAQQSGNYYAAGGAIANGSNGFATGLDGGVINISNSVFDSNKAGRIDDAIESQFAYGGAIFNLNTLNLTDSSLVNNQANGIDAKGGAIYSVGTLNINATNQNVIFNNNTTNGEGNDIYAEGAVNFNGSLNIYLNDGIRGTADISKNGSGVLLLGGQNSFDSFALNEGTLLLHSGTMSGNRFNLANNTIVSLMNNQIDAVDFGDLTLGSMISVAVDANVAIGQMDKLSASSATGGMINVSKIAVIGVSNAQKFSLAFADNTLREHISFADTQIDVSNVYKPYDVAYDATSGEFNFARGSGYHAIKPDVMAAPIALVSANLTNQYAIYDAALDNVAACSRNKYGKFICKDSVWVKGFASSENVDLKAGPTVDHNGYGSMMGISKSLSEGGEVQTSLSVFGGYMGAQDKYDGVSLKQNGGFGGLALDVRQDDLWGRATATLGATQSHYQDNDFTSLQTGAALQTGYDWRLANAVVQPSMQVSYSYLKVFDYKTAALDISDAKMNVWGLKPALKVFAPEVSGWQPYAHTAAVWSLMDKAKFYANEEALPELSLDPYVEYGLGVKKELGSFARLNAEVIGYGLSREGVGARIGLEADF